MEYPQDRDSPDFSGCFYACALGHYGTTPDLTTFACSGECPVGHRCPKGTSLPVPCPPGYHASNNGSTTCTPCGIGNSSSVPRAVDCEPCSRGSFSSLPGATACDRCAAGGYCAQVGAASASMTFEPRPVGTWSGAVGATSNATCERCPAGKANPVPGSIERTACKVCLPGSYTALVPGSFGANAGSEKCTGCDPGTFQSESGASACQVCTEGFYCPGSTSRPLGCESGAGIPHAVTLSSGASSPAECVCKREYYDDGASNHSVHCIDCPSGTDCTASAGATLVTL